jgi:hypothetical protein
VADDILEEAKREIEYIKSTKRMMVRRGERNLDLLQGLVDEIEKCRRHIYCMEGLVLSLRVDVDDLIDAFKDKVVPREG